MLKRPFIKAAASEEARRTLRYIEPLSDARTMLAVFFSILLTQSTNTQTIEAQIAIHGPNFRSTVQAAHRVVTLLNVDCEK